MARDSLTVFVDDDGESVSLLPASRRKCHHACLAVDPRLLGTPPENTLASLSIEVWKRPPFSNTTEKYYLIDVRIATAWAPNAARYGRRRIPFLALGRGCIKPPAWEPMPTKPFFRRAPLFCRFKGARIYSCFSLIAGTNGTSPNRDKRLAAARIDFKGKFLRALARRLASYAAAASRR